MFKTTTILVAKAKQAAFTRSELKIFAVFTAVHRRLSFVDSALSTPFPFGSRFFSTAGILISLLLHSLKSFSNTKVFESRRDLFIWPYHLFVLISADLMLIIEGNVGGDYYSQLGVDKNASQADIKKAFFSVASLFLPSFYQGGRCAIFDLI
jgi:hypothetical protein